MLRLAVAVPCSCSLAHPTRLHPVCAPTGERLARVFGLEEEPCRAWRAEQLKWADASPEEVAAREQSAAAEGVPGGNSVVPRTGQAELEAWQLGRLIGEAGPPIMDACYGRLFHAAQPGDGDPAVAAAAALALGVLQELRSRLPAAPDADPLVDVEMGLALCTGLLEASPALVPLIQGLNMQDRSQGGRTRG